MLQVELPGVFVMEISLAGGAPLEPDKVMWESLLLHAS